MCFTRAGHESRSNRNLIRSSPVEGLDWISALRSDAITKLATEQGPLQLSLFDATDLAEIHHPDLPGERLIACLNPLLREEQARSREVLLRATEQGLDKIVVASLSLQVPIPAR